MNEIIPGVPAALMERMSFLLKRAYALLEDAIELGLTQLNISGREFAVLTLIESEGPASQQRLADRVGVDRTTMVALVDALEEKGLVNRLRDPSNRRAYLLQTTEAGRKRLRDTLKAVKKAEKEILSPLSIAESATLSRLLQCLVQAHPPRT